MVKAIFYNIFLHKKISCSYNFLGDTMKKIILILFLLIFPMEVVALASSASSNVLMDTDSGRIIYSKNMDEKRLIASITKIMTSIIAIENANVEDVVTVGEEVLTMYGSNIYIELGEKMTLKNLLYGLMLRSGNDSAIVIATYVGKTEEKFVKMMNDKAKRIGMTNTIFNNSHGLDEITQNYSTAKDMAILSTYAMKNQIYKEIVSTESWRVQSDKKSYYWENRNKLLKLYAHATGGKTGYTPSSGRTLVTTATKKNLNLTAVTLNDPNEYNSHIELYEYGFTNYERYLVLDKNDFKIDENFYNEKIVINKSFYYPFTKDEVERVNVLVKIIKMENYNDNDIVGDVSVFLGEKEIYKDNVYIKKEKNLNAIQKICKFFIELFGGTYD